MSASRTGAARHVDGSQVEVTRDRHVERGRFPHLRERLDVGRVRVVTQQVARLVGVGADDGNGARRRPERQDPVVAEQHQALARDRRRQRPMGIGVDGRARLARVDVGLFEQAEGELEPQRAPDRVVDRSRVRVAALERREQRFGEAVAGGKLDVDAGAEGQDGGL